jgi:hypothetical protein
MLESSGRPGFDPGTEWVQAAALVLDDATVEGAGSDHPLWIYSGEVGFPGWIYSGEVIVEGIGLGIIPVPFDIAGPVEIRLEVTDWPNMTVRGSGARLLLVGEPELVMGNE